jgi:predicted PurR-regulated permease PerM
VSGPGRLRIPLGFLLPGLGALVALWFLRSALAPFFLAMVLAYLLEPAARRLSHRLGREWSAVLVILGFIVLLGLLLWAFVPPLVAQVERLINNLPAMRNRAGLRWGPWLQAHPIVQTKLAHGLESLDPMAFIKGLGIAGAGILTGFLQLMTLILVPLIVYYLLVEGHQLRLGIVALVPPRHLERVKALTAEMNLRLGGYIRGQLAVALVMSLLQGLAFQVMGVPYAWLLGLLAGFSNVVPYSPYLTALPPALLFAGLEGATGGHLLATALVFTVVQKSETVYFTPVWVGRASGLHPLEVLLAILCFGFAFGLVGLIFAVPLMIVSKVLGRALIAHYREHPWYLQDAPE